MEIGMEMGMGMLEVEITEVEVGQRLEGMGMGPHCGSFTSSWRMKSLASSEVWLKQRSSNS